MWKVGRFLFSLCKSEMDPPQPSKAWLRCWDPYPYICEGMKRFVIQYNEAFWGGQKRHLSNFGNSLTSHSCMGKASDWATEGSPGAFPPACPDWGQKGKESVGFWNLSANIPSGVQLFMSGQAVGGPQGCWVESRERNMKPGCRWP